MVKTYFAYIYVYIWLEISETIKSDIQYDSSRIMRFDFHLYFPLVHSHNDDRGCDMYMYIFCIYKYIFHVHIYNSYIYLVIYTKNENPISIWLFASQIYPFKHYSVLRLHLVTRSKVHLKITLFCCNFKYIIQDKISTEIHIMKKMIKRKEEKIKKEEKVERVV